MRSSVAHGDCTVEKRMNVVSYIPALALQGEYRVGR